MDTRTEITVILETALIFVVAYFLWFKILIPTTYFVAIVFLTALLIIQMLTNRRNSLLIFQIALLFVLIRNVYYVSTNYTIIPFDDGNWDYGVVRTFMQTGNAHVIQGQEFPSLLLTWYSGWPLLHTLAVLFSQISGIDPFQVVLLLPSIISISSFTFVYLFVEKIRKSLKLNSLVTPLALLIYTTSPDAIFWPMQFVRQNFGIFLFTITLYLVYLSTAEPRNLKYKALSIFFAMLLVMAHNFSSLIMVMYLFLLSALMALNRYPRTEFGRRISWTSPGVSTLGIALATFIFLVVWWDNFGAIIWPSIESGIKRFIEVLMGIREIEYLPAQAHYPELLTPTWLTSLLILRDLLMYIPAFLGLLLVWTRANKTPDKFFSIYSIAAFGILFIIDNLIFRVEIYRILTLSLPFIVLFSATFFTHLRKRLKRVWNVPIIATIMTVFVLSSLIGLWAHNFAPLHIYDPSISPMKVGERNTYSMRVNDFLSQQLSNNDFQKLWTDDANPLVCLLQPTNFTKIRMLKPENVPELNSEGKELIFSFKDFNLYSYFKGSRESETPNEAAIVRSELYRLLENEFTRMYDDGKYRFWVRP